MAKQKPLTFVVLLGVLLALYPAGLAAQMHFGLPSAVKSKAKQLKKEKDEKEQKITFKFAPQTKMLSSSANAGFLGVSADSATYRYNLGAGEIGALRAGDILLSAQGEGYLRKVLFVVNTGAEYQVLTTTAALNEAFEYLNIELHKTISPGDINPQSLVLPRGMSLKPQSAALGKFVVGLDQVVHDADGNPATQNDQVKVSGELNFTPTVDLIIDMPTPLNLRKFYFDVSLRQEMDLGIEAKIGITKEIVLAKFPLGAYPIGPVVITPEYTLKLGAEANISGAAGVSVHQETTVSGGLTCNGNCGNGASWIPHGDFSKNFTVTHTTVSAQAELKGYIAPEVSFKVYGIIGPYVGGKGYGKLVVQPPLNHLPWATYAGINLNAGVKLEIEALFTTFKSAWEFSLFDQEWPLPWSGVLLNQQPTVTGVTATPAVVGAGGSSSLNCGASDLDGDTLYLGWTASGGALSSTTTTPATWTAPGSTGTYTVSCAVSDGYGGSAQQSVNLTAAAGGQGTNKICLLVRNASSLDPEELAAVNFAQSKGYAVTLAGPPEIISGAVNLSSFDGFWSHTGATPTGFNTVAVIDPIKLQIQNGKYLLVSWQGKYLAQYLGAASVVTGTWNPVVYDTSYVVDIKVPHPLFTGISTWIPPTGPPDNSAQMIWKVNPGIRSAISLTPPTASTQAMVVILTTYGWPYQSPNYTLGSQYGITPTTQRNISYTQAPINEYSLGSGKVIEFTAWNGELTSVDGTRGTAGEKIYENALKYLTKTLP